MFILGLTGSIASGKSTVASFIKQKRIPLLCADIVARDSVKPGQPAYKKIVAHFGKSILNKNKSIHRIKLGTIIFNSASKRKKLNAIVHPQVRKEMMLWINKQKKLNKKLIVLDIPLLFEGGLEILCDKILVVYTPENKMLSRLRARNKFSKAEAMARIKSQISINEKKNRADFVIDNSGTLDRTKKQVNELVKTLCHPCESRDPG